MRLGFVKAVLADIDTKLDEDAIRKMVLAEAVKALPAAVRMMG
ncbi:hypothetical protein [Variovorax sp. J31P207]|nr:hypothetical protein [Variovorax sp. J31P207]MDM0070643.1 hypothetical protein [Variovorax sp. J31P207]